MGFCDRQLNLRLLKKHNNNMVQVVTELLQISNSDWYSSRCWTLLVEWWITLIEQTLIKHCNSSRLFLICVLFGGVDKTSAFLWAFDFFIFFFFHGNVKLLVTAFYELETRNPTILWTSCWNEWSWSLSFYTGSFLSGNCRQWFKLAPRRELPLLMYVKYFWQLGLLFCWLLTNFGIGNNVKCFCKM